jgi:thiol-disulfide isomerase/thioredoxin
MRVTKPLRAALIAVAAALALAAGLVAHLSWRTGAPDTAAVSALTLTRFQDLSGRPGAISDWRGQVVIVNFWASWCPPCREEIPGLISIHRQFAAKGVQVVGIAVDSVENTRTSAAELKIPYPVLIAGIDVIELTRKLGNRAGALPYTVILDREGKVVATHLGLISEAELARIVAPLSG